MTLKFVAHLSAIILGVIIQIVNVCSVFWGALQWNVKSGEAFNLLHDVGEVIFECCIEKSVEK